MLTMEFTRRGTKVFSKVLEQPDSLRGRGEIFNYDGLSIYSGNNGPDLVDTVIYIRGNCSKLDNNVGVESFKTEDEACIFMRRATELIRRFNATYPCPNMPDYCEIVGVANVLLLKLIREESLVVMTVLYQSDLIKLGSGLIYCDDLTLYSENRVELADNYIAIKGEESKEFEDAVAYRKFSSSSAAQRYINKIIKTVNNYCNATRSTVENQRDERIIAK